MGGRRAQKPGQTLSKVLAGGNSGHDEGKVEKRQRQRGGESCGKRTREREWEKQGARMVEREREQKLKKLRAKSTPIKVRAGRVLLLAPPHRPGPTRSAPRASALPHAPLLASHTPLARKLFQNFCEARYRFSIRFFSPRFPCRSITSPSLTPITTLLIIVVTRDV